jgi:hypothetical protein
MFIGDRRIDDDTLVRMREARWANCTCRKKRSTRKYGNVNGDEFAKRAIPIDPDFSDQNTRSTIIDRIIEIVDRFVSTTVGRR